MLGHYLGVEGDEKAAESVRRDVNAQDEEDEDEIEEVGVDVSPAIHAEAREVIKRHIASRDRNYSVVPNVGSDDSDG